jgi:hypothetical protein
MRGLFETGFADAFAAGFAAGRAAGFFAAVFAFGRDFSAGRGLGLLLVFAAGRGFIFGFFLAMARS